MIHVAIHDVSPRWRAEVETALGWCREVGVKPALLVVPEMHGAWRVDEDPEYVARLRSLSDEGHEVMLHGWLHLAKAGTGLSHAFAQRVVSAGEAEFAAYDEREGAEVLDRGLALLGDLGLPVAGFIPPAWARRRWLIPALRARGVDYVEDQLFAYAPVRGLRRLAPALNYASRTRGRRWSSMTYARLGRGYESLGLPLRVAIHPADLAHPRLVRETRSLLRWARGRTVDTVGALFSDAPGRR
ncbi:MAG: DUF2334 domain-containing protein [Polyangiales bacterium]